MFRTQFIFKKDWKHLVNFNILYTSLSLLLNRMISEKYFNKKLELLNVIFTSELRKVISNNKNDNTFERVLNVLDCYVKVDLFNELDRKLQKEFVWHEACKCLLVTSKKLNDLALYEAIDEAYKKGLETNLNTDYVYLKSEHLVNEHIINASVYVKHDKDKLFLIFRCTTKDIVLFESTFYEGKLFDENFIYSLKKIELRKKYFAITGINDVFDIKFPLKFPIESIFSLGVVSPTRIYR